MRFTMRLFMRLFRFAVTALCAFLLLRLVLEAYPSLLGG